MSAAIAEQFNAARPIAANGTYPIPSGGQIGGFLCCVAGTLKFAKGAAGAGDILVDALPVAAGVYYPIPITTTEATAIVLSGGARGTLYGNL